MDGLPDRLADGDAGAFVELYDKLADRLHHYLTARLGTRADADDVLQETFVRLARDRKRLGEVENLTAFAFVVARNEANRWLDGRRRHGETIAASAAALFHEAHADDRDAREAAEDVVQAMACLGPEDREIVEMRTYAGLTFREIGEVLGRPLGTVAARYRAALDRMRGWLVRERP
ncbi:RNA polymerase sigma factor [Paludisphaera rhizosphaerae]|uniref:RNA polymerase sigma factor n=1 Tax=Paludisphaera rhizosphaerae TaxID=2711216 RepID=UPI0013ED30FF|nr:RNA polymerase sigma factor [Paludisphaera rhizosphaerae]